MRLRRFEADDVDNALRLFGDPLVMRHFTGVCDRDTVRRIVEKFRSEHERYGYSMLAVEQRSDGAYVGHTGLLHWDDVDGREDVEVAYAYAPDVWGRGYATEAARACRDWAFENLGVDRVVSFIAVENAPSVAVAERNGMSRTKRLEVNRFGRPIFVYAITREQWQQRAQYSSE